MRFFVFVVLLLVCILPSSADIWLREFESGEFDRTMIRAYRIKRDWSDRMAQATGWSAWKCFHGYGFPDCMN
ncbi:hypothetical protein L596_027176 [Steinernema carpocapsae]|uniref:EMI domain-containing protein n=1 Tax=Steinernema carpocapsae TaxID=34508 RepID=A0A4U5M3K0_STECR|nr:hypothetical protein L596_027176 [Steinernema carpocapsae]